MGFYLLHVLGCVTCSVLLRVARTYQLAFFTPGMTPWSAILRKQIRHVPNFRYTARGLPQSMQRRTILVENFGGRLAAAIFDLLAICSSSSAMPDVNDAYAAASASPSFLSGTPKPFRSSRAAASVFAVVTIVMFIPCGRVTRSGLISANTICSESPRL